MKGNSQNPSFVYLKIFLVVFLLLTLGTMISRVYQLLKNKTFDERFYAVAMVGQNTTEVISFTKNDSQIKISKLHIENTNELLKNKSLFEKSFILGIPLSASIEVNKKSSDILILPNILAHVFGKKEVGSQRIGDIDYLFMYLALKKINPEEIVEKKVHIQDLQNKTVNPDELSELFRSDSIVNQKLSISIINTSGVGGAARRIADILEMTGYYVISVDSDELQDNTSVEMSSTKESFLFSYLFGVEPRIIEKNRLEDVKVIIGRNAFKDL